MATEWYLRIGDKKHGPFSSSQLKQLAENGRVTAHSKVRKGENGDWVLASKVKGLVTTGDNELPSPKQANVDQVSPQAESATKTKQPLDETESTKKWYVIKDEKEIGPVSVADLKKMAEWGTLGPNDPVRLADLDGPLPAKKAKGLFEGTTQSQQPEESEQSTAEPPPLPSEPPADQRAVTTTRTRSPGKPRPLYATEIKVFRYVRDLGAFDFGISSRQRKHIAIRPFRCFRKQEQRRRCRPGGFNCVRTVHRDRERTCVVQ